MGKEMDVEALFQWLDESTESFASHQNETYLDSLIHIMGMLFYQEVPREVSKSLSQKLAVSMNKIDSEKLDKTKLKKATQLAILKGMKDSTQQQHLMTPESIALIVAYLADKLLEGKESLRVFDPVSGTGNLLVTVLDRLSVNVQAYASEVDPTLIQLALLNANLQKQQIEFFHQDSLQPFLLDPVDLIVADLPVGYYPDDVRASHFQLNSLEGHAYSHHLLIEQSLCYTKDGGFAIFIIPESLFNSDQSDKLNAFLREEVHIIGVLQLPETAFKSKSHRKSILILQKKGEQTNGVKQPLLVQMPSFKNHHAMTDILGQMNVWFKKYHTNK